jgi:predicted MFS family arabinose efflux permease
MVAPEVHTGGAAMVTSPSAPPIATLPALTTVATAAHGVDQLALAALPLVLTAAQVPAGQISAVVAAQAAAWLLVSLPAGTLADRMSRRTIMAMGTVALAAGAGLGWATLASGPARAAPLALAGFLCSAGVVLVVLSVFALLPRLTRGQGIAVANARLEFGRASVALAAPLIAAWLIARDAAASTFLLAVIAAAIAAAAVFRLPKESPVTGSRAGLIAAMRDGARFVWSEPILRAIAICAVFWNLAFFALAAVLAPFAVRVAGLDVAAVGQGWAIYGAGLLLGAAVAPQAVRRVPTGWLFWFGPALSFASIGVLAVASRSSGPLPIWLGLFGVGFGPMLWLVLQTSVRQVLTPPDLLGRVGATLSTAIYGVRPVGALAAGWVASEFGLTAAVWLAVGLFGAALLAILLSPAVHLRTMPGTEPGHSG